MSDVPKSARLGPAHLKVRDIDRASTFYADTVGLEVDEAAGDVVILRDPRSGSDVLSLAADPLASCPRQPHAGLFHLAFLYGSRASLAAAIRRVLSSASRAHGFQDHGVSEAFYLADPEGNGIELYIDRPAMEWPRNGNRFAMYSRPIELRSWLRETADEKTQGQDAITLGHVHLRAASLTESETFYTRVVGLDVTQDDYPGARFMSFAGYHHHVAVNTWSGEGLAPKPEHATGLLGFDFHDLGNAALDALAVRAGADVTENMISLQDPNRLTLRFRP